MNFQDPRDRIISVFTEFGWLGIEMEKDKYANISKVGFILISRELDDFGDTAFYEFLGSRLEIENMLYKFIPYDPHEIMDESFKLIN